MLDMRYKMRERINSAPTAELGSSKLLTVAQITLSAEGSNQNSNDLKCDIRNITQEHEEAETTAQILFN